MMIGNFWFFITLIGTPELWLGVAAGVIVGYTVVRKKLRGKQRALAKRFSLVFVISLLLTFETTDIPRPCAGEPSCEIGSSFPSGHAASVFAVFTSLLLFARHPWLFLYIIPILVAASRVALGVHTPMDVIVGSALGVVVPIIVLKELKRRRI
jgi:membrane-associated phospholipid phosphatase